MTPEEFVAQCRTYVDVPFWHRGRSRMGIDCVGLPICAATDLGRAVVGDCAYQRDFDPNWLFRALRANCEQVAKDAAQPGDIMVFCIYGSPRHVGVYLGYNRMIHVYESVNRVCEHEMIEVWHRILHSVYRWKEWC